MKFLFPAFLFALFAIIIPILIHLFSFRRFTTVYFSNVNYLKNIKKESEKRSKLKHLLILLSRILAIAALVFAFAQPYLPSKNQQANIPDKIVSVYIDNSFSMNALSASGQLIEVARNKALEIASAYPTGTRFQLMTNDMFPMHRHLFNKEQFIQQVSEVKSSPKTVLISQIANRIVNSSSDETVKGRSVYFISDFQKRIADMQNLVSDSLNVKYLMPVTPETTSNLYIDSCWMETPAHKIEQEEQLNLRIVNNSTEAYQNLPVRFFINDSLKTLGSFNIEPGGTQTVVLKYMNLASGLQLGRAEISDYPFTHDNTFYLNYRVQSNLKVLAVYGGNDKNNIGLSYLKALFDGDNYLNFKDITLDNLPISSISDFNTLFLLNIREFSSGLISELAKACENGVSVVFFPEKDGNIINYNNLLDKFNANKLTGWDTTRLKLHGIEWEHPVYTNVFKAKSEAIAFPEINGSYIFSENIRIPETHLLWFRNNRKALSVQKYGNGNFIVFSFPLSAQNDKFARDILFVPTIYSLVINSLPHQKTDFTIGKETFANLPGMAKQNISALKIVASETEQELIPDITVSEGNNLKLNLTEFFNKAGHYLVNVSDSTLSAISMNYDRSESFMTYFKANELKLEIEKNNLKYISVIENQDKNFSETFSEIQNGKKMWKIFLIMGLFFLLCETFIIRFWK